ncbi:MAG: ribose 5-phosphate isomerase B [Dehalococcoidales bacterium]|jgi:ribose 5-phosphate isomerase B|nr:ribose 5-phosphate isomerase B [Dehalococcoidales bacterium]MDP6577521.1 ribose 5-phosphate isomerase B [Dehalococcoidales bacterium]MDP6824831.1 ribose 5-phosphate isomerase B [Dehalococcoidales bacterium]
MTLRVVLGADHGGFPLKVELLPWLKDQGYDILDLGAHTLGPTDDYPDFAIAVADAVGSGKGERGIIICGSGVGVSIAANKVPGVRAGTCHDTYSAHQGVEHDDMNVLCLGARIIGGELARELVTAFLCAKFTGEERHLRRRQKVLDIESRTLQGKENRTSKRPE